MPLFTTDETGKAFEQFMKHQPNYKPTAPRLTASRQNWTQKKKRKENAP